ncbi:MAG: helix-turn-helix transcriptional regulator [Victivallales bacterium]|jgi:transcriptional regulator with XRE-family HTH domain
MKTVRKTKTGVTVKKIDWHLLVRELLEGLFLSQQDLAERCRVSQQSISNWKNRTRNPGIFAKQKLFELAKKEEIDLSKYETDSARDAITKYLEKNKGKELVRMFDLYQKMSRRSRIKLLKYANTLTK